MSTIAIKSKPSVQVQVWATIAAIVGAVVVPQFFHVLGRISGVGSLPGETFLPMHLPIILVGMLAGPYAGAIAGFFGPLLSFALSGMPTATMLPFMMVELCAYGLFAGLLRSRPMPSVLRVLSVQLLGRVVRAAAILISVYGFSHTAVSVNSIWNSLRTGAFGIVLQLLLLPLLCYWIEHATHHER